MPFNGYNTGKDVSIQLFGNSGVITSFSMRTRFTSKQMTQRIRIRRFDAGIDYLELPDGWEGGFDYTRQTPELDNYFAQLEADYYNGVDIQPAQITETIQEVGGVISQYRYTGVMFKLDDAGDKVGDDVVKQKLSFVASRRLNIS